MGRSVGSGYVIKFIFTVHLLACVRIVWVKFGADSFTGSGDIAVFLKKTCPDSDNPGQNIFAKVYSVPHINVLFNLL